ncbi:hypothetical protein [Kitasatospora sp. NPDC101183]|uniref:hypothetical protein n=1 Tax=Kitasatospora sp. NPDC101183 TaxID=3364100 RepID=UPI003816E924
MSPFPGHAAPSDAVATATTRTAPPRQPSPAPPPTPTMPGVPLQPSAPIPAATAPTQPSPGLPPVKPVPTSVVFETVEPDRGKKRVLLAVGAVVLAVVMAGGGYLVGHQGSTSDDSPKAGPVTPSGPAADPKSPNGFMGTALTGGQQLAGGRQITGQDSKMNFMLPQEWQVQVDAKAPNEIRYAVNPYACVGHGGGACTRGIVVQNLRVLNGGWSDPKSLVLGMGQLLYNSRYGADSPTPPEPVKQSPVKIQGMDGYLALWHVPMSSGSSAPDSYCGVLEVTPAAGATTVPVLQICLDQAAEAPPLALMDQIANTVKITP